MQGDHDPLLAAWHWGRVQREVETILRRTLCLRAPIQLDLLVDWVNSPAEPQLLRLSLTTPDNPRVIAILRRVLNVDETDMLLRVTPVRSSPPPRAPPPHTPSSRRLP